MHIDINNLYMSNNNYNPKILAIPSGVHQLEGMEEDQRVIQNLLTGSNVWLSPFINTHGVIDNLENTFSNFNKNTNLNNKPNCIYFIFDKPVSVSYIQIWNYSKKPERGVKEIHISCDDNLIYKGYLKKKEETVILFTSDKMITKNINEKALPALLPAISFLFEKKIIRRKKLSRKKISCFQISCFFLSPKSNSFQSLSIPIIVGVI